MRQERAAKTDVATGLRLLPTCWVLREKNARAFALATGPLAGLEWHTVAGLVAHAGKWLDEFKGLRPDARRQAVHRALNTLKQDGVAEFDARGRYKVVRLLPGEFAKEARAISEQRSLEEAAKDFANEGNGDD
jgi:hypothetical protein